MRKRVNKDSMKTFGRFPEMGMGPIRVLVAAMGIVTAGAAFALDDITVSDVSGLVDALGKISSYRNVLVQPGTYDLSGVEMTAQSHLAISSSGHALIGLGADPSATVLKGDGAAHRVLETVSDTMVSNLTITCGYAPSGYRGGGVSNGGSIRHCIIRDNYAPYGGGVNGGSVYDSVLTGNTAKKGGGGAIGKLFRCVVTDNTAEQGGGAWSSEIRNCTFVGNKATGEWKEAAGGAVYIGSSAVVSDSYFTNNVCNHTAPCINIVDVAAGAKVVITNCTISGHTSKYYSAVHRDNGCGDFRLEILDCLFVDNKLTETGYHGGALLIAGKDGVSIDSLVWGCRFVSNSVSTTGCGGAVQGGYYEECTFTGNVAKRWGGAAYRTDGMKKCLFASNSCVKAGGAVYSCKCLDGCSFIGNDAQLGGATYGCYAVTNCAFVGNRATESYRECGGNALTVDGAAASIVGCGFTNNFTTCSDGFFGAIRVGENASGTVVSNCSFYANTAPNRGSAIGTFDDGSSAGHPAQTVTVSDCTFTANSNCQAVVLYSGSVDGCRFERNSSPGSGAAFYGKAQIRTCSFVGNSTSKAGGGAVRFTSGSGNIRDSFFSDNAARSSGNWVHGGAVYYSGALPLPMVSNCVFSGGNTAASGWGCAVLGAELYDCTFANCTNGDSLCWSLIANCNMWHCFVTNNVVTYNDSEYAALDSGIFGDVKQYSTYTNIGCVFANNMLDRNYLSRDKVQLNCTFADNIRTNGVDGGGICHQTAGCYVNCLYSKNRVGNGYADMTRRFTATNCAFTSLGGRTLADSPKAIGCWMLSRDVVRFTGGALAYDLAPSSRARNWAYSDEAIGRALGATDIYGRPRYHGVLDVGAAECPCDTGTLLLVR